MKIQVNGAWREVTATQLARALEDLGYGTSIVTTALNGAFVAALAGGDRLEVLAPMQGG